MRGPDNRLAAPVLQGPAHRGESAGYLVDLLGIGVLGDDLPDRLTDLLLGDRGVEVAVLEYRGGRLDDLLFAQLAQQQRQQGEVVLRRHTLRITLVQPVQDMLTEAGRVHGSHWYLTS